MSLLQPLFLTNSTVCCIYHRSRAVDESSSESSSESSPSSSDTDNESGDVKRKRNTHHRCRQDSHNHDRRDVLEHGSPTTSVNESSQIDSNPKKRTPNAYERMPKSRRHHSTESRPGGV